MNRNATRGVEEPGPARPKLSRLQARPDSAKLELQGAGSRSGNDTGNTHLISAYERHSSHCTRLIWIGMSPEISGPGPTAPTNMLSGGHAWPDKRDRDRRARDNIETDGPETTSKHNTTQRTLRRNNSAPKRRTTTTDTTFAGRFGTPVRDLQTYLRRLPRKTWGTFGRHVAAKSDRMGRSRHHNLMCKLVELELL